MVGGCPGSCHDSPTGWSRWRPTWAPWSGSSRGRCHRFGGDDAEEISVEAVSRAAAAGATGGAARGRSRAGRSSSTRTERASSKPERDAAVMRARDLMTRSPITIPVDMKVAALCDLLQEKNINGAPVVDGSGHLVGVVTQEDIIY